MYKLILIVVTLTIVLTSQNLFTQDKQVPQPDVPKLTKPIALVKYKDMIYHCQGIIKTKCGHTIHCGDMSVHCVTDIQVEYL